MAEQEMRVGSGERQKRFNKEREHTMIAWRCAVTERPINPPFCTELNTNKYNPNLPCKRDCSAFPRCSCNFTQQIFCSCHSPCLKCHFSVLNWMYLNHSLRVLSKCMPFMAIFLILLPFPQNRNYIPPLKSYQSFLWLSQRINHF